MQQNGNGTRNNSLWIAKNMLMGDDNLEWQSVEAFFVGSTLKKEE